VGGDVLARTFADSAGIAVGEFRLAPGSPGKGAGPMGKDLGADVDLVGPGEAYEKWKKTKEYREWRKQADALMTVAPRRPLRRHASQGTPKRLGQASRRQA